MRIGELSHRRQHGNYVFNDYLSFRYASLISSLISNNITIFNITKWLTHRNYSKRHANELQCNQATQNKKQDGGDSEGPSTRPPTQDALGPITIGGNDVFIAAYIHFQSNYNIILRGQIDRGLLISCNFHAANLKYLLTVQKTLVEEPHQEQISIRLDTICCFLWGED